MSKFRCNHSVFFHRAHRIIYNNLACFFLVRFCRLLDAGPIVLILTALVAIFTIGLGDESHNENRVSAYSVFNRGFQQLMGSVDAENLLQQHVGGGAAAAFMGVNENNNNNNQMVGLQPAARRPNDADNEEEEETNNTNNDSNDNTANHNKARKSGKKTRRRNFEQRRELQEQRRAAQEFAGDDIALQQALQDQLLAGQ